MSHLPAYFILKSSRYVLVFTFLTTILTVLLSVGITWLLGRVLLPEHIGILLLIGAIVPSILAPLVTFLIAKQSLMLYETYRKIEEISRLDCLTDLYDRRYFDVLAKKQIELSRRYGWLMWMMVIDFDRFKSINDTYGHQTGDSVLVEGSSTIKTTIRSSDICARLGGEEIVVLCSNITRNEIMNLAERIRESIASHDFKYGEFKIKVTISIGVSMLSESDICLEEAYKNADAAMYQSKMCGRNRVTLYSPDAVGKESSRAYS